MKKPHHVRILVRWAVIFLAVFSVTACAHIPSGSGAKTAVWLSAERDISPDTRQALLVRDDSFLFFTSRKVYALEKPASAWREAMAPMDAVVGRNGFAPPGEKREGDGRTPSGLYRLGTAFGYAETAVTKMPYRQALADDLWVDDVSAPDYNRWVRQSETRAASYEKMRRDDDLYKYGMVIEYNTDPVIKDYGSAIFLHVWAGARSTTAGCVAVSEDDIQRILAWLDPAAKPVILINPDPI
ncbi:MAG: L,D-transpeptidase family protein [Deltaproteobacteria bacterium]